MSRGDAIAYVAAGPALQALVGVALFSIGRPLLQFVGALAVVWALVNLYPRDRHGHASDGALLVRVLRTRQWRARTATDEIAEAANVAYAAFERNLTEERRRVLAEGLGDPALLRAAYLGWCWGEASADHRPREAALDALHEATRRGAVEPALTIAAARCLAAKGSTPGRDEGLTFHERFVPGRDERDVKRAFAYGVAVRDIERIRE
jgi:hypothetical protein